MIKQFYDFEIITPCFCTGADPTKAEIRASSIRGQLRWWFRVLGGFKSLESRPVCEQESMIFGSAAGGEGQGGNLMVRVTSSQQHSTALNADELDAGMNSPLGYALFPLRPFGASDGKKGTIDANTKFTVMLLWRGETLHWLGIQALIQVWANLGSMGFRSRRAFGAICSKSLTSEWHAALDRFTNRAGISVRRIDCNNLQDWRGTTVELLKWYRSWRQHGQMSQSWVWNDRKNKNLGGWWKAISPQQQAENRAQPGFRYARRDHNEGLSVQGTPPRNPDPEQPQGRAGQTFRPALGLPIIQFFSSLGGAEGPISRNRATVNWEENPDGGRFASPVLLRPHKDANGKWHALVIFVDARQWPDGKRVFLNGRPREVLIDLYDAMKADRSLGSFI